MEKVPPGFPWARRSRTSRKAFFNQEDIMKIKQLLIEFIVILAIAFPVAAVVSFLYSLIAHGSGKFSWGSSITTGLTLAIILPLSKLVGKK
jgi:hypothetical protein